MIKITETGRNGTELSKEYNVEGEVGRIWRLWKDDKRLYVLWVTTNGEMFDITKEDEVINAWVNGRVRTIKVGDASVSIASLLFGY